MNLSRLALPGLATFGCAFVAVAVLAVTLVGAVLVAVTWSDNSDEVVTASEIQKCGPDDGEGLDQVPPDLMPHIEDAADTAGLSPEILAAQLWAESGYDHDAVSHAGAQTIAQFMPETWPAYGEGQIEDATEEEAIQAQGEMMADMMDETESIANDTDHNVDLALAAYNAGIGTVRQVGAIPHNGETEIYVERIRDRAQQNFSDDCTSSNESVQLANYNEDGWTRPTDIDMTSTYGPRPVINTNAGPTVPYHSGIDFPIQCGDPIHAINDGVVKAVESDEFGGWYVDIDHGGDVMARYKHSASDGFHVSEGDSVTSGDHIANSGSSGLSTGCHLHFEIHLDGEHTDPDNFLEGVGVDL